jgi:hypothetical protein
MSKYREHGQLFHNYMENNHDEESRETRDEVDELQCPSHNQGHAGSGTMGGDPAAEATAEASGHRPLRFAHHPDVHSIEDGERSPNANADDTDGAMRGWSSHTPRPYGRTYTTADLLRNTVTWTTEQEGRSGQMYCCSGDRAMFLKREGRLRGPVELLVERLEYKVQFGICGEWTVVMTPTEVE